MDRHTRRLLAQTLQQMEQQGASATMAAVEPEHAAVLGRHLEVWSRLGAVRRLDPDLRNLAAGRERMLAALSAANRRGGGIFSRWWLAPLVRSAAVVIGLLILTSAAAGASAALGGPHIWRTVGVHRGSNRAIERSESGGVNPAGEDSGAILSQDDTTETVAEEGGPGDIGASGDGGDDHDEDYVHDEDPAEYDDPVTSSAVDDSEAGRGEGTDSSTSDDELDEEYEERSDKPNLNPTPTPKVGERANMEYDGDYDTGALSANIDMEVVDSENWDNAYGGDDNEGRRGETGPAAPARLHGERPTEQSDQHSAEGPGQNRQPPSRR